MMELLVCLSQQHPQLTTLYYIRVKWALALHLLGSLIINFSSAFIHSVREGDSISLRQLA
jgi:hypothetical protein